LKWQAIRDKDWKEVEYCLAPTFVGVNAEGQALDRAGWIDYWKSAQIKEFSLGEVSVHPAGPDMVVTFVLHLSGAVAGRSFPRRALRFVSAWQQVKSGWTLSAHIWRASDFRPSKLNPCGNDFSYLPDSPPAIRIKPAAHAERRDMLVKK
jgi:ketosteroid isomerase-like protein